MGVPVKSCLIIIITNLLIALYFLSACRKGVTETGFVAPTVLQIREKLEIDENFPIVFYSTAYLDYRYKIPRLRVFAMNPCVTHKEYMSAEIGLNQKKKKVKLRGEPTEGECPWHWATQCFYNSYIWTAELGEANGTEMVGIDQITIHLNNRTISLKVQEVHPKRKGGFTVCVQPVYWYSEYHNIALFIETWRSQGVTRFIVYYHSSTTQVRNLLEYYRNLGILRLRPWPSFGRLPTRLFPNLKLPSFDSSTYRVGHTLAQNLCALEMKTEIGAIADFDEVMVADKEMLINYVEEAMKPDEVGALSFSHLLVKFEPKISTMDFHGVVKPVFLDRNGPPKTIFNSSAVDIIVTHSIRRFIGNETTIRANGSLLHYRHNSYTDPAKEVQKPYSLFTSYPNLHIKRIQKTLRKVFGSSIPPYNSTYLHVLNQCITKIVGEGKCRSTVEYCKQWMEPLTDWVYDTTEGIFVV
ncbi:Glycosyltransferase family 92 protein [Caenorhabditis elegans]|uniref:Glycosyltransferase family 92 protein n=1 Tax=Caenorhabditis elegans TaxID=6239 RepID=O16275_CAEEL|nr:Glycosyltransferase family 92 protein [Caenorhabditis elegans]CCD65241.1 Glycosyltransferase family 92 protein [Caenorhabditis elegans]|eukprot:NP_504273.2 Uncharacterized protein CELE_F39G3.2 [Caenorhabditis elegans]